MNARSLSAHHEGDDPAEAVRALRASVRTRQLLRAAARLMDRDGADAVSMQALATEADVSVGLIYRYFSNRQELLLAIMLEVLDAFATRVPAAIEAAGDDAIDRVVAGFTSCCAVIDEHRHAALLTYRESKSLGADGVQRIKDLEVATSAPLRAALDAAVAAGELVDVDTDLLTFDLLLVAHAWALKHWYFERTHDLTSYARHQAALLLGPLVAAPHRGRHPELTEPLR
jgi:AcrR family transcriptional regulator